MARHTGSTANGKGGRRSATAWLVVLAWLAVAAQARAQVTGTGVPREASDVPDSVVAAIDSIYEMLFPDTARVPIVKAETDTLRPMRVARPKMKRDWGTWRPDPQRALWMALVIPGGGQIYNRKYWKLPLVYGGFVGCAYAMSWNNMMYKSYAQAYLDLMDDDPGTQSYNQYIHLGRQIDATNEERYKTIFKKRKDRYRRYRDMSFFVMVGVYALSVIDAYVDAELSEFDISKDLSLRVEPAVINSQATMGAGLFANSAVGLQCSISF